METIIEVKDISKKYKITHWQGGYVALRDIITNVFKNPFRFLRKKAASIIKGESREDFWALRDINFSVKKGEIVGIIGANGAGKSTLLKILTRITPPTTGEITINGKVSSLLEVGVGFHPELTGRENIFFYGAVLGMTRQEIIKKFDNIVEFAGMQRFLDTQIKKYSSGMYVRLAFSVAAHMEPDVLLIDEVLAVGDAEFQKKCLEKMRSAAKNENRTILFVSHNMNAVRNLCNRCILLDRGEIKMIGDTEEVIDAYLEHREGWTREEAIFKFQDDTLRPIQIKEIKILNHDRVPSSILEAGRPFYIEMDYDVNEKISSSCIIINCTNEEGIEVFSSFDIDTNPELFSVREVGKYKTVFTFPASKSISLNNGTYFIRVKLTSDPAVDHIVPIKLEDSTKKFALRQRPGVIQIGPKWEETIISPN